MFMQRSRESIGKVSLGHMGLL